MTLTPRQRDVLTKMRDGWELMKFGQAWLRNGVHRIDVNPMLFRSLVGKGLVQEVYSGELAYEYELTPAGREAVKG